jgi:hypothetical protein
MIAQTCDDPSLPRFDPMATNLNTLCDEFGEPPDSSQAPHGGYQRHHLRLNRE